MMRHLAAFLSVVVLLAGAALDTQSAARAQEATPNASPTASAAAGAFAETVDIGGRALFLNCAGEGTPTVVIDHGQWGPAPTWGCSTTRCVVTHASASTIGWGWGKATRQRHP